MTHHERALQAVEEGLLTANAIKGHLGESLSLQERMAYYRVPGFSLAYIEQSELVWAKGFGVKEARVDDPVTHATIFQAASISKPVTAMIVLSLVEAGVLDLDADVNEALHTWHIPDNEHTKEHKVTLRRLLSHTAGMSVSGYRGYPDGAPLPTFRQILDGEPPANSEPVRVVQAPGKGFTYSGGGYVVVQQLLEEVTGKSLADLAQEFVFDKLGMAHSTFEPILPERYVPQAATAHRDNGDPVPGKWHTYPEGAPASLWSTPADLAHLVVEVLKSNNAESGRVLSPEMTRHMLTPQVAWMGLGYVVDEKDGWTWITHGGWNEGFHSDFLGFLNTGQGVVWMTNGENGKLLGHEVMRGLAKVFGWPVYSQLEKIVAQVDPAVYARLAGKFRYVDYPEFSVEIIKDGDHLVLQESEGGIRFQLYPESENEFFCLHRHEKFTFIINAQGEVNTLKIGDFEQLKRAG
jgi:CubicO group peptidase (beta-lactamase class C family)